MAARKCTLRDGLYTAIVAAQSGYVVTDFDIEKSWFPHEYLENLAADHPDGKLYLVALASDEIENQARSRITLTHIPITFIFQKANVDPTGLAAIDTLVELEEQIRYTVQKATVAGYSWLRTEAQKDQSGTPYSFVMLREAHTFEATFTAYFNHVIA